MAGIPYAGLEANVAQGSRYEDLTRGALIALLGMSAALLGLALLPQRIALSLAVAARLREMRGDLALVGAALLVSVVVGVLTVLAVGA